jgi:hypothetical protein
MNVVSREELDRQFRVIDMMLTMHAALRDRYGRRATSFDVFLVVLSIVLSAFAFADDKVTRVIGLDVESTKVGIGIASVLLLAASVAGMLVDWKGAKERHSRAVLILSRLKLETRAVRKIVGREGANGSEVPERWRENARALDSLPEIPERDFVRLKAKHLRKVELSKLIDAYAALPLWVLRLILMRRSIRGGGSQNDRDRGPVEPES